MEEVACQAARIKQTLLGKEDVMATFNKSEVLAILKGMALEAHIEALGESFVEWMTDMVKDSGKEVYLASDVYTLMHANPDATPVAEIKACIYNM